ncbi:MAG TPA: alpha/beta hydrolase [Epsilonproteobacteria bacterium]|nr:alpha/beta hydrolase [Campylobacterota bacterium]
MKPFIKKISILILLAYVVIGLFLYINQRSYLYYPTPDKQTPYHHMTLHNDGESINVIVLNKGHENAILYFGGNAESMAGSSNYIAGQFPDFTVYLMDYRGYGASTGIASEKAFYSDALKLYDTIASKHKQISVGGRSLGSGIATYVAAHRKVNRLALVTPYDSIVNVAQYRYPVYPASWLLYDRYDSVSRVKEIKAETLIVIAEKDKVIPRKSTNNLIKAFNKKQLKVIVIKNRGHIDISDDARYYKIMQDFIGKG